MNARWRLPYEVSSVREARWATREFLTAAGSECMVSDAVTLIMSELVTNAVVHTQRSSGAIEVMIDCSDDKIHIEVEDDDPEPPELRPTQVDLPGGRGLAIVEGLTSAWGWSPVSGNGKRTWCDVPTHPAPFSS